MPIAKAPYNFVPVSDQVFFPDWADKISHDIPFSDGESGQLELEIEAQSPLYIRNSKKEKRADYQPVDFFNHNGQYYIPGSSLKGMIRNVVEIISYGKMKPLENGRYSIREFARGSAYNLPQDARKVRCGFLVKENEKTKVIDCGIPARISHAEIDDAFNTNFCRAFQDRGTQTKGNGSTVVENAKSASFKYRELFKEGILFNNFEVSDEQNQVGQDVVKPVFNGSGKKGTIVFTGQPNVRFREPKGKFNGKFYEFVFWKPEEPASKIDVPEDMLEDFYFIYKNYDSNNISPDWKFWKDKFNNREPVPVFFRADKSGLKDFGLSFMYKMPYKNRVQDLLPENHKKEDLDLAECMFGPSADKRDNSSTQQLFKGRVQFSHARQVGEVQVDNEVETVLGTPSASFYPFYLKQPQKGQAYKTYQNKDAELAGWKRYPVHQVIHPPYSGNENENIKTKFQPLKNGSKFSCKVQFHNLKKAEIGALLSALTFHKTQGCYHSLGMAKSLGYGKVKITVKEEGSSLKNSFDDYLKGFEDVLGSAGGLKIQDWSQHKAYCELMTMASEQPARQMSLEHMELNDFGEVKKNKELLDFYTTLDGVKEKCPRSLITPEDLKKKLFAVVEEKKAETKKLEKKMKEEEEKRKKKEEEKKKAEEEAQNQKKEALAQEGLGAVLVESIPDDFKKVSGRVDNYLKKVGKLSDADIENILYPRIKACFEKEKMKPRTFKPWQGEISKSQVWKKVSSWVGEGIAAKWRKELMGGEE